MLYSAAPSPLLMALKNTHALQWVHVDFAQLMRLCTCSFRAKRKPFEKHVIPVRLLFSQFDIKISHFALVEFIVSIMYVLHLIGKVQYNVYAHKKQRHRRIETACSLFLCSEHIIFLLFTVSALERNLIVVAICDIRGRRKIEGVRISLAPLFFKRCQMWISTLIVRVPVCMPNHGPRILVVPSPFPMISVYCYRASIHSFVFLRLAELCLFQPFSLSYYEFLSL